MESSNRNTILYDAPIRKSYYSDVIYGKTKSILKKVEYQLYENFMIYRLSIVMKNKISKYYKYGLNHDEFIEADYLGGVSLDFDKNYFFVTYLNIINNILLLSKNNDIKVALIKQPSYFDPPLQIKIQNYSIDKLWNILVSKNNVDYQIKMIDRNDSD